MTLSTVSLQNNKSWVQVIKAEENLRIVSSFHFKNNSTINILTSDTTVSSRHKQAIVRNIRNRSEQDSISGFPVKFQSLEIRELYHCSIRLLLGTRMLSLFIRVLFYLIQLIQVLYNSLRHRHDFQKCKLPNGFSHCGLHNVFYSVTWQAYLLVKACA